MFWYVQVFLVGLQGWFKWSGVGMKVGFAGLAWSRFMAGLNLGCLGAAEAGLRISSGLTREVRMCLDLGLQSASLSNVRTVAPDIFVASLPQWSASASTKFQSQAAKQIRRPLLAKRAGDAFQLDKRKLLITLSSLG